MLKLLFQVILNKFKPIDSVAVQEKVTVVKKPSVKKTVAKRPAARKVAVKKPVKKVK